MGLASTQQTLCGWGNYRHASCRVVRPETHAALSHIVMSGDAGDYIARGLGRSYGDSAVNQDGGVILSTRLNRFLSFDESEGVLTCEAGVSLKEIIDVVLPRGWFLPTTPGTKHVTVGGAVAADVHGKNHHVDGSFGNFVKELLLLTASGETQTCSPTLNAELFWATVGGMGLTGVIVCASIQLKRVSSAYVDVRYRQMRDIDHALETMNEKDRHFQYSVAWIDCLASGRSLGRSVIMHANSARLTDLPLSAQKMPLKLPSKRTISMPVYAPNCALNSQSVRAFNAWYYSRHRDRSEVVDIDQFFYPLDGVGNWNRIYGRRGFVQFQALFPPETSRRALVELLKRISSSRHASFLAVLKSCGDASKGLLSFPRRGHTLALDFPNTGEPLLRLMRELDQQTLKYGGRLYLAKDATTTADVFAEMYPQHLEFMKIRNRIDPAGRFASSQARRLGLVANSERVPRIDWQAA